MPPKESIEVLWGIVYGLNLAEEPATLSRLSELCPSIGTIALLAILNALWHQHRICVAFADGRCQFWATNSKPVHALRGRSLLDEIRSHHLRIRKNTSLKNSIVNVLP